MKKLPLGVHDYKEIIDGGYYYVDKTQFIQEVELAGKVVLVPRPRRFGKTLGMSTLRYFYEKTPTSHAYLFEHTKIAKKSDVFARQGTYPVIFLSFKDIGGATFEEALATFRIVLAQEFNRHAYLLEDPLITENEKNRFVRMQLEQGTKEDVGFSLLLLTKLLARYHDTQVVLLVDEYDTPIHAAYQNGYYEAAMTFTRTLLGSALKDNTALSKGVLTGILALAKAGIFSGLNNLVVCDLLTDECADSFGFQEHEVATMLEQYGLQQTQKDFKRWYNGYTIGSKAHMYNPWSVLSCVQQKGRFKIYWAHTSDNALLKQLIGSASATTKKDLEQLLQGEPLEKPISDSVALSEIFRSDHMVWSLLLYTGYLTYSKKQLQNNREYVLLQLPNAEIKELFAQIISHVLTASVQGEQAAELMHALVVGDRDTFATLLQSFVATSMSSFDVPHNEAERSYHLFVLGLLVMLKGYHVTSNRESGYGRYDILLSPADTSQAGIVIEFKKWRPEMHSNLEEAAQEGLQQIHAKNYLQELRGQSLSDAYLYGIAFKGKELAVAAEHVSL